MTKRKDALSSSSSSGERKTRKSIRKRSSLNEDVESLPVTSPDLTASENGAEIFLMALWSIVEAVIHFLLDGFQRILLSIAHPPSAETTQSEPLTITPKEKYPHKTMKTQKSKPEQKRKKDKRKKLRSDSKDRATTSPTATISPPISPTASVTVPTTPPNTPESSPALSPTEPLSPTSPPQQLSPTIPATQQEQPILRPRSPPSADDSNAVLPILQESATASPLRKRTKTETDVPRDKRKQLDLSQGESSNSNADTTTPPSIDDELDPSQATGPKKRKSIFRPLAHSKESPEVGRRSSLTRRSTLKRAATSTSISPPSPPSNPADDLDDLIEDGEDNFGREDLGSSSEDVFSDYNLSNSGPSDMGGEEGRKKHFRRRALGAFTKKASQVLLPTRRGSQRDSGEEGGGGGGGSGNGTPCSSPIATPTMPREDPSLEPGSPSPPQEGGDVGSETSYSPSARKPPRRARGRSLVGPNDADKINLSSGDRTSSLPASAAKERNRKPNLLAGSSPPSPIVIPRYLINKTKRVFSNDGSPINDSDGEFPLDSGSLADRLGTLDADWANYMPLLENEGDTEPEYDERDEKLQEYASKLKELDEICWRLVCGEGDFKRITYRSMLHKHQACFSGSELVTWLFTDVGFATRSEATALGQRLLDEKIIHNVLFDSVLLDSNNSYYRLMWDSKIGAKVHNACKIWRLPPRPAFVVIRELNEALNALLDKFLSRALGIINIDGLKVSRMYYDFCLATAELQRVNFCDMKPDEIKVFFINVYNILFIHGQLARGEAACQGQYAHSRFYSETSYILRGGIYSLNDIQHGILRGDDGKMSRWKGQSRWFKALDTPGKWKAALSTADPRLHFVLIGGSLSRKWVAAQGVSFVPFITLDKMEQQLTEATQVTVEEEVEFVYAKKEISLPKVFKWYASDFGQTDDDVLNFLLQHYPEGSAERHSISAFLTRGRFTVKYKQFNWASVGIGAYL